MIEPQSSPFTLQSSWNSGLKLKETLKSIPGVDISKLDRILSIFAPAPTPQIPSTCESFAVWYAADLESRNPQFKVYLNPRIFGEEKAPELVRKALLVLGYNAAWNFLSSRLEIASSKSKLAFLSLDLSTDIKARIKIYVANQLINDIEKQLQGTRHYVGGTASSWIKTLINKNDVFNVRPIVIAFTAPVEEDPKMLIWDFCILTA